MSSIVVGIATGMAGIGLLSALSALALGPGVPEGGERLEDVVTHQLIIKDNAGRVRAALGMHPVRQDVVEFALYGPNGVDQQVHCTVGGDDVVMTIMKPDRGLGLRYLCDQTSNQIDMFSAGRHLVRLAALSDTGGLSLKKVVPAPSGEENVGLETYFIQPSR